MSQKFEALIGGLHGLFHSGQLDKKGLIALGPNLGVERGSIEYGIYDELAEDDSTYFDRIHGQLRSPEGLVRLGEYYETLNKDQRREIGREINRNRTR